MNISHNYSLLALYATLFTWSITTLGSAMVFFFKKINKNILDICLALSAGIMLSASFWSLLKPSVTYAEDVGQIPFIIVSVGFILGCLFIYYTDKFFCYKFKNKKKNSKSTLLLIVSITMHNIPEGLAIGIAFGSIKYGFNSVSLSNALMLALGIGIQNFPEGSAVSLPLRREHYTRLKAFIIGSLSAVVEPVFGLIGAIITIKIRHFMPLLLAFAAGAMIYVVIKELIPQSQSNKNSSIISLFTVLGFVIMMALDIGI